MSVFASAWAWSVSDLAPTHLLVLLHLANRANDPDQPHLLGGNINNAWPTVSGIASDCGMSRRAAFRALETLRDRGLIHPIGHGGKTGQAVVYKLAGRAVPKHLPGPRWLVWNPEASNWERTDLAPGCTRDSAATVTPIRLPPVDLSQLKSELRK